MLSPVPSAAQRLLELVEITWPRFVLLQGCVIRNRPGIEDAFQQWWALHNEEPWRIEDVMNHVHLYDLVEKDYQDTDLSTLEHAAECMADAWRAALTRQFQDRAVEVTVTTEPDQYGPTVSCHQPPP